VGDAQKPAPVSRGIPIRNLAPPPPKKKNPYIQYGTYLVVLIALGVGGYFGYPYFQNWWAKIHPAEQPAAAPAQPQADTGQVAAAQAPHHHHPHPMVPPVWTLAPDPAINPEGQVNGMISGTNFVAEIARVDRVANADVLRFVQGPLLSPDRCVLVYLRIKAGENIGGQSFDITKDTKGAGVLQVTKLWKPTPTAPPLTKSYLSGYALKLNLDQITNGAVPGKIFLALPDPEQTVVAGAFEITNSPTEKPPK
jgi:hypothetical protein